MMSARVDVQRAAHRPSLFRKSSVNIPFALVALLEFPQ